MKKCKACNTKFDTAMSYCPECGALDAKERSPEITGNSWQARQDELAARVHLKDCGGEFIRVDAGSRAMIWQEGASEVMQVGPGVYHFDSFLKRLNRMFKSLDVSAIVTKEAPVALSFSFASGIQSSEFLDLDVTLAMNINIVEPRLFVTNLMGSHPIYSSHHLVDELRQTIRSILRAYFFKHSIKELQAKSLHLEIQTILEQELGQQLTNFGVGIVSIVELAVGHTAYDEHNKLRGKAWLEVDAKRAEQEQRLQLHELYREEQQHNAEKQKFDLGIQKDQLTSKDEQLNIERTELAQQLTQLEIVLAANNKKQALQQSADQALKSLAHLAQKAGLDRLDEEEQWQQTLKLARLERDRLHTEQKAKITQASLLEELAQESEIERRRYQYQQQLDAEKIENELALAERFDNEENRLLIEKLKRQKINRTDEANASLEAAELDEKLFEIKQRIKQAEFEFDQNKLLAQRQADTAQKEWEFKVASAQTKSAHELESLRFEGENQSRQAQRDYQRESERLSNAQALEMRRLDIEEQKIKSQVDITRANAQREVGIEEARANAVAERATGEKQQIEKASQQQSEFFTNVLDRFEKAQDKANTHTENIALTMSGQPAQSHKAINVSAPMAQQPSASTVQVNNYTAMAQPSPAKVNSGPRGMYCPSCQNLNPLGAVSCLKCELSFV